MRVAAKYHFEIVIRIVYETIIHTLVVLGILIGSNKQYIYSNEKRTKKRGSHWNIRRINIADSQQNFTSDFNSIIKNPVRCITPSIYLYIYDPPIK